MADRFTQWIQNRLLKRNQNFLCAFVGPPGSGKSWAALTLASKIDPNFNATKIVFTPEQFIALINSGTLRKGDAVMWDEAGISMFSRNSQTKVNKAFHFLHQSFRSMNIAVIYTCPSASYLDLGVRQVLHAMMETKVINYKTSTCWVKPLMLELDARSGKIYMKFPRFADEKNPRLKYVINRMSFLRPAQEVVDIYEQRKAEFNKDLFANIESDMKEQKEERASKAPPDLEAIVKTIRSNKAKYVNKRGTLNAGKAAIDFQIGGRYIERVRQLLSTTKKRKDMPISLINNSLGACVESKQEKKTERIAETGVGSNGGT